MSAYCGMHHLNGDCDCLRARTCGWYQLTGVCGCGAGCTVPRLEDADGPGYRAWRHYAATADGAEAIHRSGHVLARRIYMAGVSDAIRIYKAERAHRS